MRRHGAAVVGIAVRERSSRRTVAVLRAVAIDALVSGVLAGELVLAQRLVPAYRALVAVQGEAHLAGGALLLHFLAGKAVRQRKGTAVYEHVARGEAADKLRIAGSLAADVALLRVQGTQLQRAGGPAIAHHGIDKLARDYAGAHAGISIALHRAGGGHPGIYDAQILDDGILAAAEEAHLVIVLACHHEVPDYVACSVEVSIEDHLGSAHVGIQADGQEVLHAAQVNVGRQTSPVAVAAVVVHM